MALYRRLFAPLAVVLGRQPWLPRFNKLIVKCDRWLQRVTRGRVTMTGLAGLPGLVMTVPGAKSGIPRVIPLLCVPYGEGWLIAGTNWGHPDPPAWIHNVAHAAHADSDIQVSFRGRTVAAVAREIDAEERPSVWAHMLTAWPNYAVYEARVDRPIRVFLLEPR